jgi:hypothetical protein
VHSRTSGLSCIARIAASSLFVFPKGFPMNFRTTAKRLLVAMLLLSTLLGLTAQPSSGKNTPRSVATGVGDIAKKLGGALLSCASKDSLPSVTINPGFRTDSASSIFAGLENSLQYSTDRDVNGDLYGSMFIDMKPTISFTGKFGPNCKVSEDVELFRLPSPAPIPVSFLGLPATVTPIFRVSATIGIDTDLGFGVDSTYSGGLQEGVIFLAGQVLRCGANETFGCYHGFGGTVIRQKVTLAPDGSKSTEDIRITLPRNNQPRVIRPRMKWTDSLAAPDRTNRGTFSLALNFSVEFIINDLAGPRLTISGVTKALYIACPNREKGERITQVDANLDLKADVVPSKTLTEFSEYLEKTFPKQTKAFNLGVAAVKKGTGIDTEKTFSSSSLRISQSALGDTWPGVDCTDPNAATTTTTTTTSTTIPRPSSPVVPKPTKPPAPKPSVPPPPSPPAVPPTPVTPPTPKSPCQGQSLVKLSARIKQVDAFSPFLDLAGTAYPRITYLVMFPFFPEYPLSSLAYPNELFPDYQVRIDGTILPPSNTPGQVLLEPSKDWGVAADNGPIFLELYLVSYNGKLPKTVTVKGAPGCGSTVVEYSITP